MKSILNHVAYLVSSIEAVVDNNSFAADEIGEIEEFPSEGTRELYVGKGDQMGKLLLMQANGDGPYKQALDKRGPGLHHIALDVENVDSFVNQLSGSGWYLHPKSLSFYRNHRQVYLCRSGTPVLMEIQERKSLTYENYFISKMEFPFKDSRMLESLCCDRLCAGDAPKILNLSGGLVCRF